MASFRLEDLQVFSKAVAAADAISALTDRPCFAKEYQLRGQLRSASDSVVSQIAEGHGQKTDRHFAKYLYTSRGSANEVRTHLLVARGRSLIDHDECEGHRAAYEEIAKMLTGLIQHLEREDRKNRH